MTVLARRYFSRQKVLSTIRFCITFVVLSACIEPYIPPIVEAPNGILVVDGFLVSNDSTIIKLSRTSGLGELGNVEMERDAFVEIESESGLKFELINKGNGTYVAGPLNLDPSDSYGLHIRTDDTFEYRSDYVPLKQSPSLDSVTWDEELEHDRIEFNVYAHDPLNQTNYYLWTYDETWKYVSAGRSIYYHENGKIFPRKSADELYECWKTNTPRNIFINSTNSLSQDVVYDFPLFSISQTSRKLFFGYSILVKQYALTSGAYDYWNITKKNSENLGSLFDPLPAQPDGNIRCINNPSQPCIGYFTATTVQEKRVFFTRQQINGPSSGPYEETEYVFCAGKGFLLLLDEISSSSLQGNIIGDRYHDPITFEFLGYTVGPEECLDCRMKGGVTKKPDYWRD